VAKGPSSGDGISWSIVRRRFDLEEHEDALGAIRRPHRNDATVGFAQRLTRNHTSTFAHRPLTDGKSLIQTALETAGLRSRSSIPIGRAGAPDAGTDWRGVGSGTMVTRRVPRGRTSTLRRTR